MADEEEKTNHGWSGAPKNEVFKGKDTQTLSDCILQ